MKTIFVSLIVLTGLCVQSYAADKYSIDQNQVESLFSSAQEVSVFNFFDKTDFPGINNMLSPVLLNREPTPEAAFILSFCFGGLGIHRLYLGTEPVVFVVYLVSGIIAYAGYFINPIFGLVAVFNGVLWLVDTVMLGIGWSEDDVSKYVNNPSLIMW